MEQPVVFERNGRLYIVGSLAPIAPTSDQLDEFAFANELRSQAPNEHLLWLKGQYVEADRPNKNGQFWASKELAIKSLTPRLMPVTVMHRARDVVGLIADTKLILPEAASVTAPSRIETALAIWAHRFPEVAEECAFNYKQGTLMQSMECDISHYDCIDCGKSYVKLPGGAERANWCSHLRDGAEKGVPVRRLEGVTFTGTGLIFGTRNGATGALDTAHLETFQAEVAEFHERANTDRRQTRRTSVDITIPRSEYDELKAKALKADEAAARVATLETEKAALTASNEKLEIDLVAKTTEAATEKAQREALEETSRTVTLAGDRVSKLGAPFTAKLSENIKTRLSEQAKTLSDEDWATRLDELAELTGVKHDAQPEPGSTGTFTAAETAGTLLGGAPAGNGEPSRTQVSTVLGGIFASKRPARPAPTTTGK